MACYSALIRIGGPLTVEQAEAIQELVAVSGYEINTYIGAHVPTRLAKALDTTADESGRHIELVYPEAKEGEPDILDGLMKLGVAFDWYCESTVECDAWGCCFRPEQKKGGFCYDGPILWQDGYAFVDLIGGTRLPPPVLEPITLRGV